MAKAGCCPECGEPVSLFAAGCAICGADLEEHRREQAERAARRPAISLPAIPTPQLDDRVALLATCALLLAIAPFLAIIVALLAAQDPKRADVRPWLVGVIVAGAAFLFVPALRFGVWSLFL
jgi:hypothetical protein